MFRQIFIQFCIYDSAFYKKIKFISDFHDYGYPELSLKRMEHIQNGQKSNLNGTRQESEAINIRRIRSLNYSTSRFSAGKSFGHQHQSALHSSSSSSPSIQSSKVPSSSSPPSPCTKHELYVDFEKIGWSTWIISPKGYNANYCKGECNFPLDLSQFPTNHATGIVHVSHLNYIYLFFNLLFPVQSIVHELSLTPGVGSPCCVPNKLYSISLLYFDEEENVILKQYDDMVAASCGCH